MMRVLLLSFAALILRAQIVFPPDLSISRMEAVQTVQDEGQSVPLIAGKATGVRAFLRQQLRPESLVAGVTVFLRGFRDGAEIAGSPLRPLNGPITAVLQPDRGNANHSLDFILPAEWTARGRLELRAELRLPPNTVEGPADNNTLRREIEFVAPAADELRVYWLPICLASASCTGGAFQHQGLTDRLAPMADASLRYEDVPAPALVWGSDLSTEAQAQVLLNRLRKWRLFLEDSPLRAGYLVGWLPAGTAAFDTAARSGGDRAAWIVEQADGLSNQRLLLQQLSGAAAGGCDSAIGDPGFDPIGGRVVPASRNRALARCDQSAGTPWLSAADARALTVPVAPRPLAAQTDGWVFSGVVRRDGTGSLDAAFPIRTAFPAPASHATEEACLVLTGPGGAETSHCFFPFAEAAEEGTFAIRLPGTFTRARLTVNGAEAAAIGGTGQTPVVSILAPVEGETWQGTRLLQWTASDPAGRPLTYAVFYSVDDGANWMPAALDVRETQWSVDTRYLLPGQVRFRVAGSAGLDTGEAIAAPVEIPRGAKLVLPETTLSFGNATTGQIAERGLVAQNSGLSPLELSVATAPGEVFRFAMPAPLRVRAGTERQVNLRYRPRVPGQETSQFTMATSDPENEQVTVALRGAAFERLVPNATVAPRLLDFGQIDVGQTRELPFTVRNEGTAPLSVTSFSTLNARFTAVTPAGTITVPPGEERTLQVRFAPLAGDTQTGALNVATNDPSSPTLRIDLRGSGRLVVRPNIQISPIELNFGTLMLGQTSPVLPVTVRNGGAGPLSILSVTLSNPAFALLSAAALPITVPPGGQQILSLRFAPSVAGAQTGTLTIQSNDPERPSLTVALSGTGTQQAVSLEPRISYVAPVTLRPVPQGYDIRFNITVYGSNFGPGAKVFWNGSERPTELLSSTVVRGSLSPQDAAAPGDNEVTVVNPPPGGGTSGRYAVLVAPPTGTQPTAQIHEVGLNACPTVTMSVAVTNRLGLGITALNNSNLQCAEDAVAVPCTVRRALTVGSGLSILMVMHASASALDSVKKARDLSFMQQAGIRLLNSLDETTKLQVTYMDSGVRVAAPTVEFKDSVNKGALQDAINGITTTIPAGLGTALYDAIDDGLDRLATQPDRRKAMVVFTASENTFDTRGNRDLNLLFRRAQNAGVPIYLIPVGDGVQNQNLISILQQFASDSGGRVLIDRGSTLSEDLNRLAHELDNMQLIDFPAARLDGQPHRIQINFNTFDGTFRTAKVYPGCPAR